MCLHTVPDRTVSGELPVKEHADGIWGAFGNGKVGKGNQAQARVVRSPFRPSHLLHTPLSLSHALSRSLYTPPLSPLHIHQVHTRTRKSVSRYQEFLAVGFLPWVVDQAQGSWRERRASPAPLGTVRGLSAGRVCW